MKKIYIAIFILVIYKSEAQQSIARLWSDATLTAIRNDFARPPVHARNLYHIAVAMNEAYAIYDTVQQSIFINKNQNIVSCNFSNFVRPRNIDSARMEAISFAVYRIIEARFTRAPKYSTTMSEVRALMLSLKYDYLNSDTDYQNGSPAAMGNAIAKCILDYGIQDGSNELNNYAIQNYKSVNPPMYIDSAVEHKVVDPNRWQPLNVPAAIDQNGNKIPPLQKFQSPEWGRVKPFSLPAPKIYSRDGFDYNVYHDPGGFPKLDTLDASNPMSKEFKWNMEFVIAWSSQLTPFDNIVWDISPKGLGNLNTALPQTFAEYKNFFDFNNGRSLGNGYPQNPITKTPYTSQLVNRGDFTRILAQFWADGPNTETPPGHWFSLLNTQVSDRMKTKKFAGKGKVLTDLEWDLKAYLMLGAAMHDAAISAWSIKGYYDGVRPITAIRYMGKKGQCTDINLPSYHPAGLDLIPGLIEIITPTDSLALLSPANIGKIKIKVWRGHKVITDYVKDLGGVGWMLAENWEPYQEITFVTPPFAGYISGHSTFSRAAAEVLTKLTGDSYFPDGIGSYKIRAFNKFIKFEQSPSYDITLQWATYQDASNQSSLSRIWGGIHPPMDDIPGRKIGIEVAKSVFDNAVKIYYKDIDGDGYYSYEDCNDTNANIHPGAKEIIDGIDNDCDGIVDNLTAINDLFSKIQIAPNPNGLDYIQIKNIDLANCNISITNMQGEVLQSKQYGLIENQNIIYDINSIPQGIYILQIKYGSQLKNYPLVRI